MGREFAARRVIAQDRKIGATQRHPQNDAIAMADQDMSRSPYPLHDGKDREFASEERMSRITHFDIVDICTLRVVERGIKKRSRSTAFRMGS